MIFKNDTPLYSYEIIRESGENVMYINYLGAPSVPSLMDSAEVMSRTIDNLNEEGNVSRIVFVQQRNYSHDFSQVRLLLEIAQLYDFLIKREKIFSSYKLSAIPEAYSFVNRILNETLKQDPIKAYRELKGVFFEQKAIYDRYRNNFEYLRVLEKLVNFFENLGLVKKLKPFFDSYTSGDRKIYSEIFRADIMPNFTFTRMVASIPEDAEIIKQYYISSDEEKSLVTVFTLPGKSNPVYHLAPPEYLLEEDHHLLLNLARNVLIEHRPTAEEFNDPERTRQVFQNIARDLLTDLAANKILLLVIQI
jgi:hypothetical protein